MPNNGKDGYPEFSDHHKAWFMALIEGMVTKPENVNFARIKGGMDLQIAIEVDPADEKIFTPEVCAALKVLLAKVTGVCCPVVYLHNNPYPAAKEAITADRS